MSRPHVPHIRTELKPLEQSAKLQNVLYEIRGPVVAQAARLEAQGHRILKLNIGNPAPFDFPPPPDIVRGWMSSVERKGPWHVPPTLHTATRMSSVTLDFTAAVMSTQVVEVLPEPDGEPRGVRGAERGRLVDLRADDVDVEQVALELHERLVDDHAAVDLELGEAPARAGCVGAHGLEHLHGLEGGGLEHGAQGVGGVQRAVGHRQQHVVPEDQAAGQQAGEGGGPGGLRLVDDLRHAGPPASRVPANASEDQG